MAGHLPRDGEPVPLELLQHLVVRAVGGLEEGEAESFPVELEAVPQHVERALGVQFLHQDREQERLQARAVQRAHLGPELRLRFPDERERLRRKQRPRAVPFRPLAAPPGAALDKKILGAGFEGALGGLGGHGGDQGFRSRARRRAAAGQCAATTAGRISARISKEGSPLV